MLRVAFGSVVAGLIGAVAGFAAQWPVALLHMRLKGAGYTGIEPHWDVRFATFDASSHGAPLGAVLAVATYLLFFSRYSASSVGRAVPTLFAFALLGASPGIWLGPGALFTVIPLFLIGCIFVAYRLSRETSHGIAHPPQ